MVVGWTSFVDCEDVEPCLLYFALLRCVEVQWYKACVGVNVVNLLDAWVLSSSNEVVLGWHGGIKRLEARQRLEGKALFVCEVDMACFVYDARTMADCGMFCCSSKTL